MFYQSAVCMENGFAALESVLQSGCGDLAGAALRRRGPGWSGGHRWGLKWFVTVCVPSQSRRGALGGCSRVGGFPEQLGWEVWRLSWLRGSEPLGFPNPSVPPVLLKNDSGSNCWLV